MKIDLKNKKLGRFKLLPAGREFGQFTIRFKRKSVIKGFYAALTEAEETFQTNFGGNPVEWAAFVRLRQGDVIATVNSPRAANGDTTWTHPCYGDDYGFYATVSIYPEEGA